eukprot:m.125977 g.125977  ORF g.125977 m.125977 type:complete len:131 (+) comp14506_c0_seq3:190-582(+)
MVVMSRTRLGESFLELFKIKGYSNAKHRARTDFDIVWHFAQFCTAMVTPALVYVFLSQLEPPEKSKRESWQKSNSNKDCNDDSKIGDATVLDSITTKDMLKRIEALENSLKAKESVENPTQEFNFPKYED